ncbi:MAG TPA: hypothetical protein VF346_05445, partial [Bacteroidales bacterium]
MTESKKKTTKKEVVEKSDAPAKVTKRARTKEKKEKPIAKTEILTPDEVAVVTTDELPKVEEVIESVKAEDYGFDSEPKKEKRSKKIKAEPETEPDTKPETELKTELETELETEPG